MAEPRAKRKVMWAAFCFALVLLIAKGSALDSADDSDLVFDEGDANRVGEGLGGGVSPVASPLLQDERHKKAIDDENAQQKILEDDEDYVDDSGSGSGSGNAFYRATVNVTSVQYERELGDRTSHRFKFLAQALAADLQPWFDTIPGQQTLNVIKFEPSTRGVLATVDLGTTGYDDEASLRMVITRELQRGHAGNFLLSPEGFTFRSMSGADPCFPEFRCTSGNCVPRSQHCDGVPNCPDGSDELKCVPLDCGAGYFTCDDDQCVDLSRVCDGYEDCRRGEDEHPSRCPPRATTPISTVELGQCPLGQFSCSRSGPCINDRQRCDYTPDCPGGEDETFCPPCNADQFRCTDGSCINLSQFCDGRRDCADSSDEPHRCSTGPGFVCLAGEFRCDNGSCIPMLQHCDGYPDCPDNSGADERDCLCSEFEWQCDDGSCISRSNRCDGPRDCPRDDSDERACNGISSGCEPHEFRCDDRTCIGAHLQCNDRNDCYDGSDERDCPCPPHHFKCRNGFCIESKRHCDGYHNCQDGSDEIDCRVPCVPGDFRCGDGSCVPRNLRCNRQYDCVDGADERSCPSIGACRSDQFRCSNGICLNIGQRCDGVQDCFDREDERGCGCREDQFQCSDGSCIESNLRCNWSPDCVDGSDERGCGVTTTSIPPSSLCKQTDFVCDHSVCLNPNLKCDRNFDCADGSDEYICATCSYDEYVCNDGVTCIPNESKCDGRDDCPSGEDEVDCNAEPTSPDFCPPGTFRCGDNTCINEEWRCDRRPDCSDGSDEFKCECGPNEFTCHDGTCIPAREQCDGRDNCPDRSDELPCPRGCDSGQFRCSDGSCIDQSDKCNERPDCSDGSDERDCVECAYGFTTCNDGTCIDSRRRCDDQPDCADGSDELNCGEEPRDCAHYEFRCGDGECIDAGLRCDGHSDCGDRSDEHDCGCHSSQFQCGDGYCIELWNVCDGRVDCLDASDETRCNSGCQAHQFQCGDGSCIDQRLECNGRRDCNDNSDELECGTDSVASPCPPGYVACRDGNCVHSTAFCDGRIDCSDRSDEENCPGVTAKCGVQQFQCDGDTCLDNSRRCDNFYDCNDFSDEQNCESTECPRGQFRCTNGICIDSSKRCDNNYDCQDYSDELLCIECRSDQFTCGDQSCVDGTSRCDGKADCSDHSDEANCQWRPCTAREFRCENGPCITIAHRCDGRYDCPDTSDELDCPSPPIRGGFNLKTYPDYQTIHQSREVVFQCRDESDNRAPVRWSREGNQPMPPETTDIHGRLTMPNIQLEHAGTYFCTVIGGSGLQLGSQRSVYLRVEPYERPTTRPSGACGPGESTCKNGQCIQESFVCDEDLDCTDGSDEENCPLNGVECEPNEFQCNNRKCILKLWLCDGDDDCMDKSDELGCVTNPPEAPCRHDEYQCASGNQCIPKSFQCDGEVDCQDRTDESGCSSPTVVEIPPPTLNVQIGQTVVLKCRAIGNPIPLINWRLNWGHIPGPPRVTSTSENGQGVLTIRNVQLTDQGAYTCEAINNKQSILGVPDTNLIVISSGMCQPPLFNSIARSHSECLRCYCFGVSEQCSSSGNLFVSQLPGVTEMGISPVSVEPDGSFNLQDPRTVLDQQMVDFRPANGEFRLDRQVQRGQSRSIRYYWTLPRDYQGDLLRSYGGYLRYSVMYRISGSPTYSESPDVIIRGNGITISYTRDESMRPGSMNQVQIRFWEGNWLILGSGRQPSASREDLMTVLQNVESFLIRAVYDENFMESSLFGISMDTAVPQASGQQQAVYVEQCTCPPGYSGSSCQSCASGYSRSRSPSISSPLGECHPATTCNCHGHSTSCNERGECDFCQHNTEGAECERCRPGFYGDATRGTPTDCQPCPCPLTQSSNQFSSSCFLERDGQITCDACQRGYEGRRCERCSYGFSGDPMIPGDSCRPAESQCDHFGSASPTPNPVTGLCSCKAFTTGATCGDCREYSYHLNPHSQGGCIPCFCMGVTRNCASCSLYRSQESARFTSDDTRGFTLATLDDSGQQVADRGLQVTDRELVYREFYFLQRGKTYYWRLPETFLGNKMSSYGGNLNYTIRFNGHQSAASNLDADVQIVGNHITLEYFHKQQLLANVPNTVSVPMFEHFWRRTDGQTTTREHLMMALADVVSFHIKATYTPDTIESALSEVVLEIAEDRRGRGRLAVEVEKCNCPAGYKGLSCEECDVGYKRTGGGLYLGLCEPCFCNGHSSDCDPNTGTCRNCQHNTEGEICEVCKPLYEGDATRGTSQDCYKPTNGCRCNVQGSIHHECDERKECACKANAEGPNCDRCRDGYFNLEARNPDGCTACFCFGATDRCSSSSYYRAQARVQVTDARSHGVSLTTKDRDRVIVDGIGVNPVRNEISFRGFPQQSARDDTLFWSLPEQFTGNKLTSYGGVLKFTQRYISRRQGEIRDDSDVIILGNGISLIYTAPLPLQPDEGRHNVIEMIEAQWQVSDGYASRPATREQFLTALSNVESILIRASFNYRMIDSVLSDVSMDMAVPRVTGQEIASAVEQCSCPPGYTGLSCEQCAAGYDREPTYGGVLGRCVRCNCHGHSTSCDPNTALCSRCEHNTEGYACERCARGFYGDATRGTPQDCQPCPCPLTAPSNQFSPTCRLDSDGRATCDACPEGYAGRNCEQCAPGFQGDPRREGDSCRPSGVPPSFTVRIEEPRVVRTEVGQSVAFRCSADVRDSVTYTWTKEGGSVPSHAYIREGTLSINNIRKDDSGTYVCTVTDRRGQQSQDRATVLVSDSGDGGGPVVDESPRVWIEPRFIEAQVGEYIEFRCLTSGHPQPSLQWTGGPDGQPNPASSFRDGVFRIPSVQKSDQSEYFCTATSSAGTDSVRTILYVIGDAGPTLTPEANVAVISPPSYSASVGETVRFECKPESSITGARIEWSRSDGQPLPSGATQARGVLTLHNVDHTCQGTYVCAIITATETSYAQAQLHFISGGGGASKRPTAHVEPDQQSASVGSSVEMRCVVDGHPYPTVRWSKLREELNPSHEIIGTNLRLTSVTQRDRGIYVCEAENSEGSAQATTILEVDRRELPAVEIYPGTIQEVKRGESAIFQCRVSAGSPYPRVQWTRADGRPLARSAELLSGGTVIRFNRVVGDEAGQYVCTAENDEGMVTATVTLTIQGLPVVKISPASPYTVSLGQRVHLECIGEGDPIPSVSWTQSHQPYAYRDNIRDTPGIAILEIAQVRHEDAGEYVCTARNTAGSSESRLQLIVEGSPLTNPGIGTDQNVFKVPEGSSAEMNCYAVGSETSGLSFDWVRANNQPLPVSHTIRNGLLVIESVRKEDAGEYHCLAMEHGVVIYSISQELVVVVPPRLSLNPIRQSARPGDNIYVQCHAEGDQPIRIEWNRLGGTLGPRTYSEGGLLQFRGVSLTDAGRYMCVASNAAGRAEAVAEVLVNEIGDCADFGSECAISPDCFGPANSCSEEPVITMPTRVLHEFLGSTVDLPCEVRGTPTPTVMWSKEGGDLPFNSRIVDTNLRITSLHIEDAGRYYCVATNDVGSTRDFLELHVRGLSPVTVRIDPSLEVVRLGDSIDVLCEVSGDPKALISWSRLGGSLPRNAQTAGNLLRITNVQAENGGVYQCHVDAFTGTFTEDYVLSIQAIPSLPQNREPEPGVVETRTAPFGSTVVMDCRSNLRHPVNYAWSRQGSLLPADATFQGPVLTIPDVRAEDAGTYICTAKNYDSKVDFPIILTVTGVISYFAQAPSSFMALPTLPLGYVSFDVEISFKPDASDGLILYDAQRTGGSGDFFSFGLSAGYAEFRFDVGAGPAILRSTELLELGEWHTARFIRDEKEGMLSVNNQSVVNGTAPGTFKGLDLKEPLYVGGVPDFNNIHRLAGFREGFVGCISRLVAGATTYQLIRDAQVTSGITNCETCAVNPCSNGGVCQESHTFNGRTCICSPGFSGPRCDEVGEACYPGVCGSGRCINRPDRGFDCHCPFGKAGTRCERDITIYEPAFRDDAFVAYPTPNTRALRHLKIATRFKARQLKDGIIAYCGQNENGQGDFISLALKNQRVEFRFDTGSGPAVLQSRDEVREDQWVEVKAERNYQQGSLVVNDGEEVKGRSQGHTRGLNLHLPLYVGGVDLHRITINPLVEVNHGFDGCISHMEVSGVEVDLINSVVDSANVEDCGGQNPCDRHPCLNGGVCRDLGPKPLDYKCTCQPGFRGSNCDVEDDLCQVIEPCLNGGTCVGTGTSYKCNCPHFYTGTNCGEKVKFTTSVKFQGDGFLELPRDLMPHTSSTLAEVISLQFETSEPNGLIFWHGQKPDTDGKGKDFVALSVVDGYLEFSFALGNGPAQIRSSVRVDDGNEHTVVLRRLARDGSLELDKVFTQYGETQGTLQMLDTAGNIYLGGVPDHELMTASHYKTSFIGCLRNLQIQENEVLDLQSRSVYGINVASCNGEQAHNLHHSDNRVE